MCESRVKYPVQFQPVYNSIHWHTAKSHSVKNNTSQITWTQMNTIFMSNDMTSRSCVVVKTMGVNSKLWDFLCKLLMHQIKK